MPIDDQMLIEAVRQRLLEEFKKKGGDAHAIVNNVYGSPMAGGSGIMGALGGEGAGDSPDPRGDEDYFVDIIRKNIDANDPSQGWSKNVHRYKKKVKT